MKQLLDANEQKVATRVAERVLKCLKRAMDEPLEMKYQKVFLDSFFRGDPVKGGSELFELMGFIVGEHENQVLQARPVARFPPGVFTSELDLALITMRIKNVEDSLRQLASWKPSTPTPSSGAKLIPDAF